MSHIIHRYEAVVRKGSITKPVELHLASGINLRLYPSDESGIVSIEFEEMDSPGVEEEIKNAKLK
jgi:hypothetical protein